MAERKKVVKKAPTARKPRAKKPTKNTYIALVIDKSSSMSNVYHAALSGLNEQIKTIKANAKKGGKTFVTLVQFADDAKVLFDKKPASELQELTPAEYQPNGWTAMRDGIYEGIKSLKNVCTCGKEADNAFLVITITDGEENRSRHITQFQLAEEIKMLEKTGRWTFTYMMSNVDVKQYQQAYGIHFGNVSTYVSNNIGTQDAFLRSATATANYMSERDAGAKSVLSFYNGTTTVPNTVDPNVTITGNTIDPTKLVTNTISHEAVKTVLENMNKVSAPKNMNKVSAPKKNL